MSHRILVVEDEPTILELISQVLEEEGYDVTRSANGARALEAMSANAPFDLVLLDMWMPNVNGWEFATALSERKVSVPILVMTAASDASRHAETIGAVGYIGKPFNVDQLLATVRDALRPDQWPPHPSTPPSPRPAGEGLFPAGRALFGLATA